MCAVRTCGGGQGHPCPPNRCGNPPGGGDKHEVWVRHPAQDVHIRCLNLATRARHVVCGASTDIDGDVVIAKSRCMPDDRVCNEHYSVSSVGLPESLSRLKVAFECDLLPVHVLVSKYTVQASMHRRFADSGCCLRSTTQCCSVNYTATPIH